MRLLLLGCLLPALLLTACGAGAGAGGPAVEGRTFLSTAVTEDGRPRELADGSRISLSFEDGQLRASAGCNTMGGAYTLEGQTLAAGPLAMTEMGCAPALMEQDAWLADLLTGGPALALDGDELALTSGSTVVTLLDRVVADPDRPLVGTTWRVDGLVSGETVSSTPGDAEATLTFAEDGSVEVLAGCNRGRGTWSEGEDGQSLTVGPLALTRMACEGARGELEASVLQVLGAGELQVDITAATLRLTAGDAGLVLRAG